MFSVAATLLVAAGHNANRLRKKPLFEAFYGVNPPPASSGTTTRHRLNRGGFRSANNALWTGAMVRMRDKGRQRSYQTKKITRSLKRYIARELFPLSLKDLAVLA
ncbi:transposase [Photobacterium kasasachensis]|uniref:transposase n=1 Tax=Photobacterium kasasachensis TaxID=2910240 RepID=UPI003D098DD4